MDCWNLINLKGVCFFKNRSSMFNRTVPHPNLLMHPVPVIPVPVAPRDDEHEKMLRTIEHIISAIVAVVIYCIILWNYWY